MCCELLDDDDIKELIPPLGPRKRFKEAILARHSSPVTSRAAAVVTPTLDDGARADDDDERSCAICFDELANPVRVDCAGGHEFCRRCWLGWRKQLILKSSTSTTCPSCRADVKLVLDTATMKPFEADRAPAWGGAGVAVPRREASARPRGPASVTPDAARADARATAAAESRRRATVAAESRRRAEAEAEAQRRAAVQARRAAAKAAKKERQRERKRTQIAPAATAAPTPAPVSRPRRPAAEAAPSRQHRGGGSLWQPGDPPRRALDAASAGSWLESRMRQPALRPAVAVESFESMLRPLAAGAPQAPIPPSPLDWTGF
jgi:hypothetical protein